MPILTQRLTNEAFAALGAPSLVYVRPVKAGELVASTPVQTAEGLAIPPDQILFALHRADGACLGIMTDRDSAIAAAMAHEMAPVSVH